jgi:thiamine-phosphate pyrophosphorylase
MGYTARIVLFAPREEDHVLLSNALNAAFAGGRIDAVIVTLPEGDERERINFAKAIAPVVQGAGAACLLADAVELVARSGADGVHLSSSARAIETINSLHRVDRSVGIGGLKARHDAMEVAELGADYVMFGEPRPDGSLPTLEMVLERTEWWAELFNTPCVAYASDMAHIAPLVGTGAEFIGLGESVFSHPEGPTEAIRQALVLIAESPAPQRG